MKGRIFSATMLVIVLALVLAVPASAGKPPPPPGDIMVSVGRWAYQTVCPKGNCATASNVTARNIAWSNASAANTLLAGCYSCDAGAAPGPVNAAGCAWTEANRQDITATPQGKLRSKTFRVDWAECSDYYPAILLVHTDGTTTEVLARALGSKIAGLCF
jgi:hypothetical protein